MKLLLDTHIYAWWAAGHRNLSASARNAIEAPSVELLLSSVVPWEMAQKLRVGKWDEAASLLANLDQAITAQRLTPLPITLSHAQRAGLLDWDHRDPFDRMLAAQAEIEDAILVTADPVFSSAGIRLLS